MSRIIRLILVFPLSHLFYTCLLWLPVMLSVTFGGIDEP